MTQPEPEAPPLFGLTRSRLARDHALLTPESHVRAPLPGWTGSTGIVLIAPRLGAGFVQYLALMEPGARAARPAAGVERFLLVLEGRLRLRLPGLEADLDAEHFAYLPPEVDFALQAVAGSRILVVEKRFQASTAAPPALHGALRDVEGRPFLGDPDARLQTLLPDLPAFDMAMNVFTFRPGATLPLVEMHVMEHGLLMLAGQGIYRLGDSWYPVRTGDALWMAPYCPQWFAAVGKTPARYVYYKDANRDPLEAGG